jgi:hypothetical protein
MKRASMVKLGLIALAIAAGVPRALAAPGQLPPIQHEGDVAFLTGGVGQGESTAIKDAMHKYPLSLEFAGKTGGGNEYLSDIPVQVSDAHGHAVLNTTTSGPFLLASLPDGRYSVTARYNGKAEHRDVDITSSSHVRELFLWPM